MRDFPNRFYLELQRTGRENDESYLHSAVALAETLLCPVVATNDVRFLNRDEFEVIFIFVLILFFCFPSWFCGYFFATFFFAVV